MYVVEQGARKERVYTYYSLYMFLFHFESPRSKKKNFHYQQNYILFWAKIKKAGKM